MQANKPESKRTSFDKCTHTDEVRQRINELLWDFYGEFPLSNSDWQTVVIREKS